MSQSKLIDADDVLDTHCNYCQEPFEQDTDIDCNDQPATFIDVPVECDKGRFCSEAHRAQAMYDAQSEDGKQVLRRYYLGAQLVEEYCGRVEDIMDEWELDYTSIHDPESVSGALSPDGGIRGKEGPEDDCDAKLVPEDVYQVLWTGLYEGQVAAEAEQIRIVVQLTTAGEGWVDYWQRNLDAAKVKAEAARAALKALQALKGIV